MPVTECGCWIWLGMVDGGGYGSFRIGAKMVKAHRASWIIHRGPIPEGLRVLHQCDMPPCINPDHLFLGTQLENMQDMFAKGRQPNLHGEKNPNVKLTAADVSVIREADGYYGILSKLGRQFGVSATMILNIRSGKNWRQA